MVKRRVRRAISPPSSTLFSAPAPSQSRSRLYSHGHSRALHQIRGPSRNRSQSPWTEDSNAETTSHSSFQSNTEANVDEKDNDIRTHEPSHRRLHLQKVFDLLNLSISRRDGVRSFRCLRILLKSHEWRPIELWRYALEVATLTGISADLSEGEASMTASRQDRISQKRLAFLREVSKARTGLQLDVFIEIIPELLALGEEQQALAELDIVLHQYPYRLEPILHLYSAIIFLKLSSPSTEKEDTRIQYTLRDVSEADRAIAYVPNDLLLLRNKGDQTARSILKEAERKFETVVNVGKIQSKRGRRDVVRSQEVSRSRSRSRSKSRSRSRSKSRARGNIKQDATLSEHTEDEGAMATTDDEDGQLPMNIGNDDWARNVARAYLAVLRAPLTMHAAVHDSEEELHDDLSE